MPLGLRLGLEAAALGESRKEVGTLVLHRTFRFVLSGTRSLPAECKGNENDE